MNDMNNGKDADFYQTYITFFSEHAHLLTQIRQEKYSFVIFFLLGMASCARNNIKCNKEYILSSLFLVNNDTLVIFTPI